MREQATSREHHQTQPMFVVLALYKSIAIGSGLFFGYLGYRLFLAGVFEKAGQLEHAFGKEHLLIKEAAPGTFFAVLGCAIIIVTLWRGLTVSLDAETKLKPLARQVDSEKNALEKWRDDDEAQHRTMFRGGGN